MGACTFTNTTRNVEGNRSVIKATMSPSASYATSGDTIAAADLGLTVIDDVKVPAGDGTNLYFYDHANLKLKAYVLATQAQVASAVNLSAVDLNVEVTGY